MKTKEDCYNEATLKSLSESSTETRQDVIYRAMDIYSDQFKSNKLFEFIYNGMTEESSYATMSVHRTREGAEKAMNNHKEQERIEHEQKMESYIKSWKEEGFDDKTIAEFSEIHQFGQFEDWDVHEIDVLD
jgi:hypothetical protein